MRSGGKGLRGVKSDPSNLFEWVRVVWNGRPDQGAVPTDSTCVHRSQGKGNDVTEGRLNTCGKMWESPFLLGTNARRGGSCYFVDT